MAYDFGAFDQQAYQNYQNGGTPLLPDPPQSSIEQGVPEHYGISIQKVGGNPGNLICYALGVDHLPCGQNGGMHNVFVQILDKNGNPIAHSGQYPGFPSALGHDRDRQHFLVLDKPPNERKDMVMWAGQVYTMEGYAQGEGQQNIFQSSAVVKGLASTWADECSDVTWGHHSFYVVLMADILEEEVEPPTSPVAVIQGPVAAQVGQTVTFSGGNSQGTIVEYAWNMGDGATASGVNVSHIYQAVGTYKVYLTVTDQNTLQSTAEHLISITEETEPPPTGPVIYDLEGTLVIDQEKGELDLVVKGKK